MDAQLEAKDGTTKETLTKRSTSKQVILALLTNFSSIGPSMTLGFSAVVIPTLKKTFTDDQVSWFASITALAAPFGCFFSGPIADRFGRRAAIFCINITCFIGWMTIYVAHRLHEDKYWLLLLGRLLTGFSVGLSSAPATIYMAEVSSSSLRTMFTTWGSISFSTGILAVYILGFFLKESWGLMALVTCAFPCLGIAFIAFLVPESPSWLVGKNRLDEAKNNMCQVFGTKEYNPYVQSEVEALIKAKGVKASTQTKPMLEQMLRKVKYLLEPQCLKPFTLVFVYFIFQQFAGTFVLVFYAVDIVTKAGVSLDPYLTTVMIGAIRLGTAVLVSCISKRFGRRPLSIASGLGMTLCMLVLACHCLLVNHHQVGGNLETKLTIIPLLCLLLHFVASTLGFLPMPFALAAEVFPTKIRGTASGLLAGSGYLFNFIVVKVYPSMVKSVGSTGVFFFYGGVSLLGTVFVTCLLPETKGKSLQEILEYFGEKPDVETGEKKPLE
ncbi:hypothetical protein NQ315_000240 [Exocentrus adspersus]|uniref:Major facilitator superfamily (MFS) profile domain-containing protein n=1 Tax=Exocentrus adspersus TaxID=1586481 RepID=A0AAV8VRK5_9CUCU|nr:hypothetical protein NQ315_000240 [Exocentrus adspersus]